MTRGHLMCVVVALGLVAGAPFAAMAEGEDERKLGWSGTLGAGVALTEGTTDTVGFNANGLAKHLWERDELNFELNAFFQENDGERAANNQRAKTGYRHDFTDRFFLFSDHAVSRDPIQLINFRYANATGPGYRWWEAGEKRYFDTKVGVGYLHQQYRQSIDDDSDTENTREDTRNDATVNAAFEHANLIGDVLELLHTAGILIPVSNADEFIVVTELTASVPIAAGWSFRNTFGLEYQNEPADDADDTNIRYTAGVGYDF